MIIAGAFWAQSRRKQFIVVHKGALPLSRYRDEIALVRTKKDSESLAQRLSELIEASEKQHLAQGKGVCPWYYDQLAQVYRNHQRYVEELTTLQRFSTQTHPPHPSVQVLLGRLSSARSDAAKRGRKLIEEELLLRAVQA
jgi:hypothetical protein